MTIHVWLIPGMVTVVPLDNGKAPLSVVWTNGLKGKWDGRPLEIHDCQKELLEALSKQEAVDVSKWPARCQESIPEIERYRDDVDRRSRCGRDAVA